MTLLRQLILAILTVLLLVFAGSVAINVVNTRHYLDAQLQSHAQDAATSLGLSLSTSVAEDDRATMESMVDAMFDSGYYRSIDLVDIDGALLLHRSQPMRMGEVPDWFVRLLPLHSPLGEAMLMSGWRQLGQVRVRSNPGYAYLELWRTTLDSMRLFAVVTALALLLAVFGVRMLLRPLRATEAQAIAIADREFPVQERLPRTRELRRVVQAMNHMSRKVRQMLHEQITLSEALRAQAFRDPVTGPEEHFRGVLALVQLRDFKGFNDAHGYTAGDELLRQAADALRQASADFAPHSLARLGGADFGLLLARGEDEAVAELGTALSRALASLHECGLLAEADVGHVGLAVHTGNDTPSELLSRADAALRAAQSQAGNAWHLAATAAGAGSRPASAWRELLNDGLQDGALALYAQPVMRLGDGTALHHEVLVRLHSDGELLPAGGFMPMAERFGLASAVDRAVIGAVLLRLPELPAEQCLAVNLSPSSLADAPFLQWLEDRLAAQPALAARLTFEVPEYGAARHLPALRRLSGLLSRTGSGLGLDHFGRGFNPFGYLAGLKLRYIKVDGRYTHALPQDSDSRFFVRTLREVAHGLDCLIVAETVEDAAQLAAVGELRMDGAQGYHLARPQPL
jgi:diguanylate cyclase (GGDEF)-like protein